MIHFLWMLQSHLSPGLGTNRQRGADKKDTAGADALETKVGHIGMRVSRLCQDAAEDSDGRKNGNDLGDKGEAKKRERERERSRGVKTKERRDDT